MRVDAFDLDRALRQRFRYQDGAVETPHVVYRVTIEARWADGAEAEKRFLQYGFGVARETAANAASGMYEDIQALEAEHLEESRE